MDHGFSGDDLERRVGNGKKDEGRKGIASWKKHWQYSERVVGVSSSCGPPVPPAINMCDHWQHVRKAKPRERTRGSG